MEDTNRRSIQLYIARPIFDAEAGHFYAMATTSWEDDLDGETEDPCLPVDPDDPEQMRHLVRSLYDEVVEALELGSEKLSPSDSQNSDPAESDNFAIAVAFSKDPFDALCSACIKVAQKTERALQLPRGMLQQTFFESALEVMYCPN